METTSGWPIRRKPVSPVCLCGSAAESGTNRAVTSAQEAGNTIIVSNAGSLAREIHRHLADAAEAHRVSDARHLQGKLVLAVR
jgi:hypothetical protein